MATIEDAEEVGFHNRAKILRRHFFNRSENPDSRIVHQDVETAQLQHCQLKQRLYLGLISNIAHYARDLALTPRHQVANRLIDHVSAARADANTYSLSH